MVPINDPPPSFANLTEAIWYSQLDDRRTAVVVECPAGRFTPFFTVEGLYCQTEAKTSFRDAAQNALRMAHQRGAPVDPENWPDYFPG